MRPFRRHKLSIVLPALALVVVACGDATDEAPDLEPDLAETEGPVANACPADGCQVRIVDVALDGDELQITWEANFLPDMSGNHIHVYWDIYTADQVSDDAQARGVDQGDWDPTDAYPNYTTTAGASVAGRGDSTTVCVTAGDRDHVVLDSGLVDCRPVDELLDG